jgi:hypothetical protein
MTSLFTADPSYNNKQVSLLTDVLGNPVPARVQDVTIPDQPWDHVVRTLSDLPAPVGGPPGLINLTAGSWYFAEALNIGNNIIVVPAATECHLKGTWGKFLTGTSTNLIAVNGAALLETMVLSNDAPLLLSGIGGICHLIESEIIAISTCILTTVGFGYLQVTGGLWQRFGGTPAGLYLNSDVTRVQLNGVSAVGLTHFIQHVAGVIGECSAIGCNSDSTNGVTWLAANIPPNGLALVGNVFNSIAPYNGFTQASARVNCKANLGAGILLSETPIVP